MQKISVGLVIGVVFALAPLCAYAIGFAPQQSLFLSKNSVTEGDTVIIHAVANNDGSDAFAGTMQFKDETESIGNVPVSLKAGEAGTISTSWTPSAGTHSVTANLVSSAGVTVATTNESFVINSKPQPAAPPAPDTSNNTSATASTPVDSSKSIQQSIANISPAVAQVSSPVLSTIDAGRTATAGALDSGIAWSKSQLVQTQKANAKASAKTATSGVSQSSILNTLWTVFATVSLFVLSALRYLIGNAGMFYPFLLVVFFYFLWRLFRGMRRSNY